MSEHPRKLIFEMLAKQGELRTADVVQATGLSRAYVNRVLQQLRSEGLIALVGKANRARYIDTKTGVYEKTQKQEIRFHRILRNENLSEDAVLEEVKRQTGIMHGAPENIARIVDYAFMEMLNNAIEHSDSRTIDVQMAKGKSGISFRVRDYGIGIFRHIMRGRALRTELEAIQDLIKGKQTTAPERHSGEGIFFTSKVADKLAISGSAKKLMFDNTIPDVYVADAKAIEGTQVTFSISLDSQKNLVSVFKQYTGESYEFGRTEVTVEMFKSESDLLSRSQARRLLAGLEKFSTVVLDFRNVETIGQAFADEVFRVWQRNHPDIGIEVRNTKENVDFMIRHVR